MDSDPFAPPSADLTEPHTGALSESSRLSLAPIFVGGILTSGIGGFLALVAFGLLAFALTSGLNLPLDSIEAFFNGQTPSGTLFFCSWGLAFAFVGGAVAARLSNARPVYHACAAGAAFVVAALCFEAGYGFPRASRPLAAVYYATLVLRVPASMLGGWWILGSRRRNALFETRDDA
jgi:hypothetical protein